MSTITLNVEMTKNEFRKAFTDNFDHIYLRVKADKAGKTKLSDSKYFTVGAEISIDENVTVAEFEKEATAKTGMDVSIYYETKPEAGKSKYYLARKNDSDTTLADLESRVAEMDGIVSQKEYMDKLVSGKKSTKEIKGENKIVRLTIKSDAGAMITVGGVTDEDEKDIVKEAIDNNEAGSSMSSEDGESVNAYDFYEIAAVNGPNLEDGPVLILEETTDVEEEDDDERTYEEISNIKLGESSVNTFITSYVDIDNIDTDDYSNDDLILINEVVEKRIHYPILIEIREYESFDLSNIYIGTVNFQEIIGHGEIVDVVLYISDEKAKEYLVEYLGDVEEGNTLAEFMSEIFTEEDTELKEKILENHQIIPEDIEGKGESENDYVKIMTLDGNVLFESVDEKYY